MTKTFGNNGGDESKSSGPETPTSDSESSGEVKVLNWVHQSIDVESAYDNDARDQVNDKTFDDPDVLEGNGVIGVGVNNEGVQYSVSALLVLILLLKRLNDRYIKKKKMEAAIQRRIWDPRIKIYFRHHLEDKVVVKEWGMIRPRYVKDLSIDIPFIFDIGQHTLEFGRRKFCLVTYFRFGDCSLDHLSGGQSGFRDRVFLGIAKVKGIYLNKLPHNQTAFNNLLDDDVVRVCLLLALDFVFMAYELRHVNVNEVLNLVDDLSAWNNFPWGEHMW
ncbi:phospholipase-like protein [Tanacetum coccineum]